MNFSLQVFKLLNSVLGVEHSLIPMMCSTAAPDKHVIITSLFAASHCLLGHNTTFVGGSSKT